MKSNQGVNARINLNSHSNTPTTLSDYVTMSEPDVMINGSLNGEWKYESSCWRYLDGTGFMTTVPHTCGYDELVSRLSMLLNIDTTEHDVVLTSSANDALVPTKVTNDDNVKNVLLRYPTNNRTVLCINTIAKPMPFAVQSAKKVKAITQFHDKQSDESDAENEEIKPEELGYLNAVVDGVTIERCNHCILPAHVHDEIANISGAMASDEIDDDEMDDGIRLTQTYKSKSILYDELSMHAVRNNFHISTYKSTRSFVVYVCKAGKESCSWRLRAKRQVGAKGTMIITKYIAEHTCGYRPLRRGGHRNATPAVLGSYFKDNVMTDGSAFRPRHLQTSAKRLLGLNIDYHKAYKAREISIQLIHGSPEDSYAQLPSYFHMLIQKNPGTICDIAVDEGGAFLYCYFSLGVCQSGFRWCRPLICIDGTHLKNRYHGDLLCAIALDANEQLYPVAFAIVDSENDESYNYFMMWLKKSIGDVPGLAFISDRHPSIYKAIKAYFPDANHGLCYYHIKGNMKNKYGNNSCVEVFKKAVYAYTKSQFMRHFNVISETNSEMAKDLKKIGFSKWARAFFPGMRYGMMTNNYCESFNSKVRDARKWTITSLVEYTRCVLQNWHAERIEKANKTQTYLAPNMEVALEINIERGRYLTVQPISFYEFWVTGPKTKKSKVDLKKMTCDCQKFNVHGIPCEHGCAAIDDRAGGLREFCDWYFTTDTLRNTYSDYVYPCGDESEWIIPDHIKQFHVGVPKPRPLSGRPKKGRGRLKTKRIPSQGERLRSGYVCSQCNKPGHNKATCKWY